ncbi:MAG: efflux RND transporter periplasmic adaptor subunit [Proteobacteria bacterium]|nr:efflux RND transporter periplasmic adaptor subunit [Pseudomonadota bacterium]
MKNINFNLKKYLCSFRAFTYQLIKSDIFIFLKEKITIKVAFVFIILAIFFTLKFGTDGTVPSSNISIPLASPFTNSISGDGVIECNTRNLNLGSYVPGIVADINFKEGDDVKKGDIIIQLDDRVLKHEVLQNEASYYASKLQYEESLEQLNRAKKLKKDVISFEEERKRQFQHDKFFAAMNLQIELLSISKVKLEQTRIIAPCDGKILKITPTLGSYISNSDPIVVMGNVFPLHIRVYIDENDIADFNKNAAAVAIERSYSQKPIPLTFIGCEPIAKSKTVLQGTSREVVDTRVIEIIYAMPMDINLYVGQRVDVYIDRHC